MVQPLPPPGWYPDPGQRPGARRWWDGRAWSEDVRAGEPAERDGGRQPRWPAHLPEAPAEGPTIPTRAAWWAVVGLLLGEVLGGLLAGGIASATHEKLTGALPELGGEIGLWAGMIGSCLIVSQQFGSGSLTRDFTLRFRPKDLLFGVAAALVGIGVVDVVVAAFSGTSFAGTNTQILNGQRGNGAGYAIVTIIAAVGAPFFEELFFRGLLRTAFTARLGPTGAIWGQAVLFGLAHFQPATGLGNVSVIVAIGLLGVVLGYTARWTGRLGAGMVAHSLFNLTSAVSILVG